MKITFLVLFLNLFLFLNRQPPRTVVALLLQSLSKLSTKIKQYRLPCIIYCLFCYRLELFRVFVFARSAVFCWSCLFLHDELFLQFVLRFCSCCCSCWPPLGSLRTLLLSYDMLVLTLNSWTGSKLVQKENK